MPDGMSFDKYIDNPSGGQAFTNRNMYKAMYKGKFDTLMVREQGVINWKVFKTEDANDTWFIYMRIPSEVIDNFYYDVVLKFFTTDNIKKAEANIRRYAVQFYSNDPAFCYTFAHSFKVNKLFINEVKTKMPTSYLNTVASVKNPKNQVWYVKSLFFAYLTMEKYGLWRRSMLNQHAERYKQPNLLQLITPADIKIKARQKAQADLEAKLRKEKEKRNAQQRNVGVSTRVSNNAPMVRKIKTINKTATVNSTRNTKKTTMSKKTTSNIS